MGEVTAMEYQMSLIKIWDALLKRKWVVIIVGVIASLLGFVFITGDNPNLYAASSSIYAASYASYQETVQAMNIMRDYVEVIRSRKVAERASGYLSQTVSASAIMGMVSPNYASDSKIITITATSSDPQLAMAVANAVADAFIQEIVSITAAESIKVLDSAYTSRMVSNAQRDAMQNRLLLTGAAVVVTALIIAVFAAFNTRVCYPVEVTLGGKIELLGVIPDKTI